MADSTFKKLLLALERVVSAVDKVGVVHTFERYAADPDTFDSLFRTTVGNRKQIRAWTITRNATSAVASQFDKVTRTYTYTVRGYMGYEDKTATELEFQELIELVMDALDQQDDLDETAVLYSVGPSQLRTLELRQFGSVLVHYAEILVSAQVEKAITWA